MAYPNPQNQYLKTQVETASREQLVVMLFDGIVRFTEQARKAIEDNEIENVHHRLMRAQAIIMELIYTIDRDKGGQIANNLLSLHAYAFNCLIVANMKKDVSKIDEGQKIYRGLREGWVAAMGSLGIGGAGAASAPLPAPAAKAPLQEPRSPGQPAAHSGGDGGKAAAANVKAAVGGYGMGKTAPLVARSPVSSAAMAFTHQQQRSTAAVSAYTSGRSIA